MSEYVCDGCGKPDLENYLYISNPAKNLDDYASDHLCEECSVALWPCNVQLVFYYGIPIEVRKHFQRFDVLKRLRNWNIPHKFVPVHIFHRRQTESTHWLFDWDHRSQYGKPGKPYGYRGWCSGSEIILLYDETETIESLEWIFYHELGHAVCNRTRMYDQAMEQENKTEGRTGYEWRDDEGHELDSEERLVNRIATAYMAGQERARPWWRPRVIAADRGYTVLPDAFAPPRSPENEMFRFAVAEGWTAKRRDGSMLPIHGYDYTQIAPHVNPQAFSEEERRSSDFRRMLKDRICPVPSGIPAVPVIPSSASTWSDASS